MMIDTTASAKVTFFIAAYRQTKMSNQFVPSLSHENLRPSTFDPSDFVFQPSAVSLTIEVRYSWRSKWKELDRTTLWRMEFLSQYELKNP